MAAHEPQTVWGPNTSDARRFVGLHVLLHRVIS